MNVMSPQTLPPEAAAAEWVAGLRRGAGAAGCRRRRGIVHCRAGTGATCWPSAGTSRPPAAGRRVEARLRDALPMVRPRGLRLAPHRTAPRQVTRAGHEVVELFLAFETATGSAEGVARLMPDAGGPGGMRAWILLTALQELRGHPDRAGRQHTSEKDYSRDFGGPNWADKREAARAYADHDPAVIVVGCGQAGLGIAARLGALGIDTLVVDREERVGDNWRGATIR